MHNFLTENGRSYLVIHISNAM